MKRTDTSAPAHSNRRALILHHDPALLADPEVVAFLDEQGTARVDQFSLEGKFILANEPALLMELARTRRSDYLKLTLNIDGMADPHSLHAGFFDHVLQHLGEAPSVTTIQVAGADLTAATCALLQAALQAPGCQLRRLSFSNCCFVDAHARFPTSAPTVRELAWVNLYAAPPAAPELSQLLPSLSGWTNLGMVRLMSLGTPVNFGVLAQLLQANQHIEHLLLASDEVPSPAGHPAPDPQLNPALLFDAIKHNRTALTQLTLQLSDPDNLNFDDQLLQLIGDCLSVNTTLQGLDLPGVHLYSDASLQQFTHDLWTNHTLISLAPNVPFGLQPLAPIRRNQAWHFRLTPEFVLGAAEAFMRLKGTPPEIGALVSTHLASTSADRIYCAPVMALVCKATNEGAVRLRSACLRDALIKYIVVGDARSSKDLIANMARVNLELLSTDKAQVVRQARLKNRMDCLPAGYAL